MASTSIIFIVLAMFLSAAMGAILPVAQSYNAHVINHAVATPIAAAAPLVAAAAPAPFVAAAAPAPLVAAPAPAPLVAAAAPAPLLAGPVPAPYFARSSYIASPYSYPYTYPYIL